MASPWLTQGFKRPHSLHTLPAPVTQPVPTAITTLHLSLPGYQRFSQSSPGISQRLSCPTFPRAASGQLEPSLLTPAPSLPHPTFTIPLLSSALGSPPSLGAQWLLFLHTPLSSPVWLPLAQVTDDIFLHQPPCLLIHFTLHSTNPQHNTALCAFSPYSTHPPLTTSHFHSKHSIGSRQSFWPFQICSSSITW